LGAVERYDQARTDAGGGNVDGDYGRAARVRTGNEGRERLPHPTRHPGAEHGVDDDVCLVKEAGDRIGVGGAPDRVEGDGAVPEESELGGGRGGRRTAVGVDDVDRIEVLEVAG